MCCYTQLHKPPFLTLTQQVFNEKNLVCVLECLFYSFGSFGCFIYLNSSVLTVSVWWDFVRPLTWLSSSFQVQAESLQHVANKPVFSSARPSCVLLFCCEGPQLYRKSPQEGALISNSLALVAALVTCYSTLICFVCPVNVTAKGCQYFLFVFHIKSPVVTGIYCEIFAGICCGELTEAAAICPTRYSAEVLSDPVGPVWCLTSNQSASFSSGPACSSKPEVEPLTLRTCEFSVWTFCEDRKCVSSLVHFLLSVNVRYVQQMM